MNIKPMNISEEEKTRIFEKSLKNQTPYIEKEPVKIKPVFQWISVKDRLPKEQECVIVHEKDLGVLLGDYQGIKYSQPVWIARKSELIMLTTEVTHWQPLPEPPTNKI